jgi:hypothetical protein
MTAQVARAIARQLALVCIAVGLASPAVALPPEVGVVAASIDLRFTPTGDVAVVERYRVNAGPGGWPLRFDRLIEPILVLSDGTRVTRQLEPVAAQLGPVSVPLAVETIEGRTRLVAALNAVAPASRTVDLALRYELKSALLRSNSSVVLVHDVVAGGLGSAPRQLALAVPDPGAITQGVIEAWITAGAERRPVKLGFSRAGGQLLIRPRQPLFSGEGLLVAVRYPAGTAKPSVQTQASASELSAPRLLVAGALAALVLLLAGATGILLARWRAVHVRCEANADGQLAPPFGLSPAVARLVRTGSCDDVTLVAVIATLAQKGYLTVEHVGGEEWMLQRTWREGDLGLAPSERAVAAAFYEQRPARFFLSPGHRPQIDRAGAELDDALPAELRRATAVAARDVLIGLAVLTAVLAMVLAAAAIGPGGVPVGLLIGLAAYFMIAHRPFIIRPTSASRQSDRSAWLPRIGGAAAGLALLLAALSGGFGVAVALSVLLITAWLVHLWLLSAAGFRQCLAAGVEAMEAQLAGRAPVGWLPPEPTPATFEAGLPYALALALVPAWAGRFALARPRRDQPTLWRPRWLSTPARVIHPAQIAELIRNGLSEGLHRAVAPRGAAPRPAKPTLQEAL